MTSETAPHDEPGHRAIALPLPEVRRRLFAALRTHPPVALPVASAVGRIAARDVTAPAPCPAADVASIDGWAVASIEMIGAAPVAPVYLSGGRPIVAGESLPAGHDAVLAPHQGREESGFLVAEAPLAPGENVLRRGGDIAPGALLVPTGKALDTFDLALLRLAGIADVAVARAGIAVSAEGSATASALAECLAGLCRRAGAEVVVPGDDGTPVDLAVGIGATIGDERAAIVPALVGADRVRIVLGADCPTLHLPDRLDVLALAFETLVAPTLDRLLGRAPTVAAETRPLARKIASRVGMSEIALLEVTAEGAWRPLAIGELPSSAWARAQGVVELAPQSEGSPEGAPLAASPPRFRI